MIISRIHGVPELVALFNRDSEASGLGSDGLPWGGGFFVGAANDRIEVGGAFDLVDEGPSSSLRRLMVGAEPVDQLPECWR